MLYESTQEENDELKEENKKLKKENSVRKAVFDIVKDENEVNKKNLHKFIDEKKEAREEAQKNTKKLDAVEKVITDTQGWGDFIADLPEEQIELLREAGYPDEDDVVE